MLGYILKKIFGTKNDREIKRLSRYVKKSTSSNRRPGLTDAELRERTNQFRTRLADGAALDDLLIETFAVVREAAKRRVGMRPFDVQLIGGMVLHEGKIAEMKTGEGKTLAATLPIYLNALTGAGVHVVTVNDYLASGTPSGWGADLRIPRPFRGCVIVHGLSDCQRKRPTGGTSPTRTEQRVRIRLSPGQHEIPPGGLTYRGNSIRHRRRGGQHLSSTRREPHSSSPVLPTNRRTSITGSTS